MIDTFVNPVSIGSTGLMITVMGWLIKRWINGTAHDIRDLKRDKMDSKYCDSKREACTVCFAGIKDDLARLHLQMEAITGNIPVLAENQKNITSSLDVLTKLAQRRDQG